MVSEESPAPGGSRPLRGVPTGVPNGVPSGVTGHMRNGQMIQCMQSLTSNPKPL